MATLRARGAAVVIPASSDPKTRELAEDLPAELLAFAEALVALVAAEVRASQDVLREAEDDATRAA